MRRDEEGTVVECTPSEFGQLLEDYFGGKYTKGQLDEVARWAKRRGGRTLAIVYRYAILNEDTQYNKPPTIKALNKSLREVREAYPELDANSYNRQLAENKGLLTDDAGFNDGTELLKAVSQAMAEGRDPREDGTVREIAQRNGVAM